MDDFNIVAEYALDEQIDRKYVFVYNIILKIAKCDDFDEISKIAYISASHNIHTKTQYYNLICLIIMSKQLLNYEMIDDSDYYYVLFPMCESESTTDFLVLGISAMFLKVSVLIIDKIFTNNIHRDYYVKGYHNVYPELLFCHFTNDAMIGQISKIKIDSDEVDFEFLFCYHTDQDHIMLLKIIKDEFNYDTEMCRSIIFYADDKHGMCDAKLYRKY